MDTKFIKINIIKKTLETNLEILKLKKSQAKYQEDLKVIAQQVRITKKAINFIQSIKHEDVLDHIYNRFIYKNEFWFCQVVNIIASKKTISWDTTDKGYEEFLAMLEEQRLMAEVEIANIRKNYGTNKA